MKGVLRRRRGAGGFTLVELLTVVAVIAVLAALLLPALTAAQRKGRAAACAGNLRQFGIAWTLYAADNGDRLVPNGGGSRGATVLADATGSNWINNLMDWEKSPDNTNTGFVNRAMLTRYLGRVTPIYSCPSDHVLSDLQRRAGWTGRVRSYSMNAMVGDAGGAMLYGINLNNPGYRQFLRLADIPGPTGVYVFLDEHPDSIDDGYFVNNLDVSQWIDLPASYHDGAAAFAFADGHAELHRWRDPGTTPPSLAESVTLPFPPGPGGSADFRWLADRTSVER